MIVFEKVTKQFSDNPPAVEEVSFSVEPGEFLFLTGHSGSGKTTLLKLLTREYTLSSGEIQFDGQPLTKLKSGKVHHHRRKIGVVFQDYRLLPELNVWENIALALEIIGKPDKEIEERVTDLLDLVQLTDKAYFFPAELSGGESQRVGIARALATAPNVLLADEPTGNLDPENTLMIARLFDKIHQLGTTVLFATHDLSVLDSLGHRRIKMEKGRILEDKPATGEAAEKAKAAKAKIAEKSEKAEDKKETSKKSEKKEEKASTEPKVSKEVEKELPPGDDTSDKKSISSESKAPPVKEKSVKKARKFPSFSSFRFNLFGKKKKEVLSEDDASASKPKSDVNVKIEEL